MIGDKIRAFRKLNNLNQVEFAASLGISQGNLSEIEKGKSKPSADTLLALRKTYGLDINFLLGEDASKDSKLVDGWNLSPTEVRLISQFRLLSSSKQKEIIGFLDFKLTHI